MTVPEFPLDRSDPRFGHIVAAPAPEDRDALAWLCVNPHGTIRHILAGGLVDRFAEYEGLVHGTCIPNGTAGMMSATALFRGLKRPMIARGFDMSVLAYVLNPLQTYRYPIPHRVGLDPPLREPAYPDSVFVVYADVSEAARERATRIAERVGGIHFAPRGMVYNWEWVLASENDETLPASFNDRYLERMW